jgi:hypothetical protein
MRVFLTSNDLPEVPQPIECQVINEGDGWENASTLVVEVAPTFNVNWGGRQIEVVRLILSPVRGSHQPDAFFEDHTWVDVFLPAESGERSEQLNGRLCVGLMHRTKAAAQDYLPP